MSLAPDGTYRAENMGDVGSWGWAEGRWHIEGRDLVLDATRVHDDPPLPPRVHIQGNWHVALVVPETWQPGAFRMRWQALRHVSCGKSETIEQAEAGNGE